MKPLYFVLRFTVVLLFISTIVNAQGTVRGVVTDSTNNDMLVGANVILVGTALGSATDLEGEYHIVKVPEGSYRLKISYVGYFSKEFNIVVSDDKTLVFNIKLRPDVIEGDEIVVTGQALGQAAAINQQLSSNTIVNVISEQKIKELPDANAAESIGRLPGVSILRSGGEANKVILRGLSDRYTTVTIDGVQIAPTDASSRGLDLSTISQSSLAGIELFKALTPDKDADAIAGSINLVTKKAPSLREITAEMKGNYNNIMESFKQYDFSFRYGERFFEDFLGVQVNGNLENKIRSNERINIDYIYSGNDNLEYNISNLTLDFNDEIRKRGGFGLLLDINTPDNGSIKLSNVFNSTTRDYINHNRDFGGGQGGAVTYSFQDIEREISTFNSSLTGDNTLLDLNITWGLSFAQSLAETPYNYYIDFLEGSVPDYSGMGNRPTTLKENPERLIPAAYNNFKAATLYSSIFRTNKNFDKEKTAFLNLSKEYLLDNNISGTLKFGGKYKTVSRSFSNSYSYAPYYLGYWQPYQRAEDGSIVPKDLSGTEFDAFFQRFKQNPINRSLSFQEILDNEPQSRDLFDLYKLSPLINRDKMHQWYDLNKNGISQNGLSKEFNIDPSVDANFYDVTETVTSGYVMNTLNLGHSLIFIAGVRVESEDNFYKSKYSPKQIGGFPIPIGVVNDTSASHKETIVLPNFHLNFKATDFLNIRVAVYKALSRPDFNMRLNTYFAWRPAATSATKQLFVGNPLLKTAQAWNYEVNTSFYGNQIGLISVSAFYKEIKDMYHMLNGINTSGNVLFKHLGLDWQTLHEGTYALTIPYNSPKASKVWGFEFEHQINFNFLPGFLKNFVLSYNASIVRSETHLISSATDTVKYFLPGIPFPFYKYEERAIETKQQLENQPEFYGNISLGYDIGGFSARVSLFHQSEYNVLFTPKGLADQIINPFTRLDVVIKQQVTDYLSLMLSISNLTNIKEENSIYNRVQDYKILDTSERYGLTADFGVKLTL